MKKILITFGTRPEAIKMAPLVKEFQKYPTIFELAVCATAQHREMLDQVLDLFEIKPDFDLNIMKSNQDLTDMSTAILTQFKEVLRSFQPDLVLIHGDTTTSTMAGLAAFYFGAKIGHVEAGLRTYDRQNPWPEEMNRQLTGRLANFHFAPTVISRRNLIQENVKDSGIVVTGNTVIDALFWVVNKLEASKQVGNEIRSKFESLGLELDRKMVLITGHRRENFGKGFREICQGLQKVARAFPDVEFVYPVHLNPRVKTVVYEALGKESNIKLIPPLDYFHFVWLMQQSYLILTDSGGIQEEAPSLGKPVLVMRSTTERPEALQEGTVKLVGANAGGIFKGISELLTCPETYEKMAQAHNPYGDGLACGRIVSWLKGQV